jgi:DNA primase
LVARALELHGTASPEAKLAALNFILPYLSRVPNALIRSELMADIAQKLDVNSGVIREAFQKATASRQSSVQPPAERRSRIPAAEAMLIRLLLEDEAARQQIPALLERSDLVEEMACKEIVSGLLGMIAADAEPDLTALADRLPETQQRILAEVAFESQDRPVAISEISTYISALERRRLQRVRDSLQRRILEAQKSQDHRTAVELLQDQQELDRKLGRLL